MAKSRLQKIFGISELGDFPSFRPLIFHIRRRAGGLPKRPLRMKEDLIHAWNNVFVCQRGRQCTALDLSYGDDMVGLVSHLK